MESLSIQVPIPVFARMTDKLRQELMAAEQEKLENFEAQLLTLQNYSRNEPGMLEQQQKLMAQHEACQLRANKIQEAPAGSKFMLRVLQGSLPLKVGDNLLETLHAEILLEDGVVTEIGCPESQFTD
jgi:hypothetical protein